MWVSDWLSFFLVTFRSCSTPFYFQNATSQGTCPNSLLFRCFHFILTFEFIKELGSASVLKCSNVNNGIQHSHKSNRIPQYTLLYIYWNTTSAFCHYPCFTCTKWNIFKHWHIVEQSPNMLNAPCFACISTKLLPTYTSKSKTLLMMCSCINMPSLLQP